MSDNTCLSLSLLICRVRIIADVLDHTEQILGKDAEASCTASRWKTLEMREWAVHLAKRLSNSRFKRLLLTT